jgi:plasmid stabilization system protein ParE
MANLGDIGEYLAADAPATVDKWLRRLVKAPTRLAFMPFSGRVVPEYGEENVREVIVGPYRIVYAVTDDEVLVLYVFHGRRSVPPDRLH